jgi:hypothetical protein
MSDQIVAALVTALTLATIAVAGWLVTEFLARRRERRLRRDEAALRFLERQIEELYGPLVGLIQYSKHIFEVAQQRLPTENGRIIYEHFNSEHTTILRFFIENYFLPSNKQIGNLIRGKMHLLESASLPESFVQFFRHEAMYECLDRLWREKRIPSMIPGEGWPQSFGPDAVATLERLSSKHRDYLKRLTSLHSDSQRPA